MNIEQAKEIYSNPKSRNKETLLKCLNVLNSQEVVVNTLQFKALQDALDRLEKGEKINGTL